MKRNLLAVIIPALLVAGAANAAEIYNKDGNKLNLYGKVNAGHKFSSHFLNNGDTTYLQTGIKGETQVNSELTGYGQFEYRIYANKTESEAINQQLRLAFAGLKFADYGSLDYGRNYGLIYDTLAFTDALPDFGGDSAVSDVYMVKRANGLLTYRNTNFFGLVEGLNFAVQYQGKNERSDSANDVDGTLNGGVSKGPTPAATGTYRSVSKENGDGFSVSTLYKSDFGVSAGVSYFASDRTKNAQSDPDLGISGKTAEGFTAALKYDANNLYLATMYAEFLNTYIANKVRTFEAVAQYQFDFGLRPSLAYMQSKGYDFNNVNSDDKDIYKYVSVGSNYYFNKNISTYVDYKINLLDKHQPSNVYSGSNTRNVVSVGMVYQF